MQKLLLSFLIFFLSLSGFCQNTGRQDSAKTQVLDSVMVIANLKNYSMQPLPTVQGVYVYSGKNTMTFQPDPSTANLAGNMTRMAFAKIPGLNVWEMDGAGTQVNIGSRGTDAHRSIEMNMRQNGYNTNSDMFGYPEDHYTPPMQAINQVQYVRGSAALQFGSQFGGMMNYVMKSGDSTKPFSLESEQTIGGYSFFNSYNAVGGTLGKWTYYAYVDYRHGNGWRPNANFDYHSYYANLIYRFNEKASLSFQFSNMSYVQKIAGGLTDSLFNLSPDQSFRARNYFQPQITIPALIFNYAFSTETKLEVIANGLFGQRNSVQFINNANIMDTINTTLGTYNPRQVDRDYYDGFTTEMRLLHLYKTGQTKSALTSGIRFFTEETKRRQKGTGTTGSDFDLSLVKPYGIDLDFHTNNVAFFAENEFQLNPKLSMTPGFRYEIIQSNLNGLIANASFPVSYVESRNFPLFGLGTRFQINPASQLYGNISQAYRPFLYANITPADQLAVIDSNLRDSRGYDVDLGYRGHIRDVFQFNINGFYLFYGNRIGQLTLTKPDNSTYIFTTNVGNSLAVGVETYLEASLLNWINGRSTMTDIRVFNSLAYTHARYITGHTTVSGKNVSLAGNYVEGTPDWVERGGIQFIYRGFSTSIQYSYVSKGYSDAVNTVFNPTGASGVVPEYHVWDWSFDWHFLRSYHVGAGINNLANASYFTRRINMYPGPGILPADGRTFYVTLGLKI